jgi:hypothetical protein
LPEDGHFGRITTEAGDVLMNPFDGSSLVAESQVLGVFGCAWEAEDVEAVG